MKFIIHFILFAFLISLYSCNNKLEKSHFELAHSENILSFSNYYVIQWEDTLHENMVTLDSTIELQFVGVSGFKLYNNNAFVGASMTLKDSTGAILFQDQDLFLDYDSIGFDPEMVKARVGIFLVTSHPMVKGGTYSWSTKIWDKKGEGEIKTEAIIKIK